MKNKNNNVIPRDFIKIVAKSVNGSSGANAGDIWHIYKNDSGLLGLNTRTGKYYYMFSSHLRNKSFYEFLEVER